MMRRTLIDPEQLQALQDLTSSVASLTVQLNNKAAHLHHIDEAIIAVITDAHWLRHLLACNPIEQRRPT